MNAIEFNHVNKSFGSFAIEDLNLTVPTGTICGLVGENGAGKSTSIKLLLNALRPDSGTIQVLGTDTCDPAYVAVKNDIGVVLDDAWFPETITAKQVGSIMADTYVNWDSALYESYLTRFSLPRDKKFKDFSRGMRMKLSIAVALSHDPKLLVLDEATAGLDPIVRDEVVELFNEFTREETHSILISSHILSDLEKLCDYIAFIHEGRLLFCEEKDRLLEEYAIFVGTTEQADSLLPEAIVHREGNGLGGVRAMVRRSQVPATLTLEKPTMEDIILNLVKGAKRS